MEITPSISSLKVKQDEKSLKEHVATAPPTTLKELLVTQTKARQTKKTVNGSSYGVQPKGKQSKQKATSKEIATTNTYQLPSLIDRSTAKQAPSDVEFPPLSLCPLSQTLSRPIQAHLTSNVRPPPGLLAPPGFFGQPDLEGLSAHSSPSSSPHRLTSQHSPKIQLVPDSEMEIMHCPPLNNDLLFLIRSGDISLESSLFQPALYGNSPRAGTDIALSIPLFRSQSFTSNSGEAPDVQALLGAGSNFNVSNFLDRILGDSTQQTPTRNEVVQKPAEVAEAIPFQANTIGVPLDPWNHCDDSINNNPLSTLGGAVNYQESPMIAGIPLNGNAPSLLAESPLLNFANVIYAEPAYASIVTDDGGGDSDFLEPDSFYNQLLGEDF